LHFCLAAASGAWLLAGVTPVHKIVRIAKAVALSFISRDG
jgi:hypothetical protein